MAENRFQLTKDMEVVDQNDRSIGKIENIYAENESGASRFIRVDGRLLPVETIEGVEQEKAKLAIGKDKLDSFPRPEAGEMPTARHQQEAYGAMGLSGPAVDER